MIDSTVSEQLKWLPSVVIPITELVPDHLNPRKGKVSELIASLKEFGQHRDLVVQRGTNRILIGNHMHKAAIALGWSHIACKFVDDNDIKAMRRALADNRIGQLGGWDDEVLAKVLEQTGHDIPGFDEKFIEKLLAPKGENKLLEEPTFPIVAKLSESYHCVIVFATNDIDWNFLETALQLEKSKSYKNVALGKSIVVTAEKFAQMWRNRNA